MPETLRNPLYHWAAMELKRPFGIDALLSPRTAREIFDRCNGLLQQDGSTALGLLQQFKVAVVCTTDDPADTLEAHKALAQRKDPATRVYPTWRPDKALNVGDRAAWSGWVARLEETAGAAVTTFESFLEVLDSCGRCRTSGSSPGSWA